ncbi:hypothetical protein [Paenibacillus mucilaginosus]|uniref:Lipoprotein n=2 Tax=Paenibacillus mucilaginosus TaxID=61624 RepID=F8F9W4_PAEMK|nr:hypothetical protein [Paenibacillus mucilaginosus]AEI45162.1 hypothetical protein KNP414_06642 [Paenibacillus mucilaginosus KNP414]MCG7212944.1 hypothetical protein [Paenibacillus mucilaginosus]WDM26643.1 hypothetical protein KCX80_30150 [Paenibacillus mucilaginosus]
MGMRQGARLMLVVILLIFAAGCAPDKDAPAKQAGQAESRATDTAAENREAWHPTVDEAVKAGIAAEDGRLLSVEKDEAETFVFFMARTGGAEGALGVASITKGEQGYRWYRAEAYHASQSVDVPFDTMSFTVKAESGHTIKVYSGRVYDPAIRKMNLLENGVLLQAKEIADPKSGLYYFMVERRKVPLESGAYEVKPAV